MTLSIEPSQLEARPEAKRVPLYAQLGFQIGVGTVLGIGVGFLAPHFALSLKILGDIFLRLIKMIVAPLVFLNVVLGISAAGNLKNVGKLGVRAIVYFEVVSSVALLIGMIVANLTRVGAGTHLVVTMTGAAAASDTYGHNAPLTLQGFLLEIVPDSFVGAFASGSLLQVLLISIAFGAALLAVESSARVSLERGLSYIAEAFFRFVDVIMMFAPIGAFGAIAFAVASSGRSALVSMVYLLLVLYTTLALFIVVIMGIILKVYEFNIFLFLRYFKSEILLLFATASSESALPRLFEKLELLGCSRQAVGMVLPMGYAFNLDGTAVYMSLCVMFLANAYGVPLSQHQQIGLLLLMLVTSKGAATVSGGTFIVFASTVTASGLLPIEGLPLLFGINRLTSQAVCICNSLGNAAATLVISKSTGEFDELVARAEYARVLGRAIDAKL